MKNIILLSLLIVAFTASCQNIDIKKQIEDDYKKSISFFSNDLVSHFPVELPDSSSFGATVPKKDTLKMLGFGIDGIMLWKHYQSLKYLELRNYFDNLARAKYYPLDTTLLLVFSYCDNLEVEGRIFKNQESPEKKKLAKQNVTTATSLPVPLFEIDEYLGNTKCGLSEDFKLYVLEAKPGKYLSDEYLQECECLPEKWKHGYSKGVALSDTKQVVIYWIAVW